jgi:thiol-disulfide isomerase/thioredoxin
MSRKQQTKSKTQAASRPIVVLAGAALAAVALGGGLWLGGVFGSDTGPAQSGAPGRVDGAQSAQAPADAAQPAAAMDQAASASDAAMGDHNDGTDAQAAAPPAAQSAGDAQPSDTTAHDGSMGGEDAAAGGAMDSGAVAAAPPAVDPADLYQVTYADHEPQALTAAAEGKLGTPALVMFHADWCHVCQEVMPTVHELRDQYKGELAVVKVNVDQRDPAMANYPVRGTPTFVIFDRFGQAVKTQSGWPGEPLMAQYLDMAVAIQ